MKNTRLKKASTIFFSSIVNNLSTAILSFLSRTVFIYSLGTSYLGLNGLFTNVLSIVSFAELGIGAAITFSLYSPLANKDTKKIQALMNFYKKAYRIVALVVLFIGLLLIPFLKYIINGIDEVNNILIIYLLFLFNTVSSYFITYKTTLLSADQKENVINNNNTIFKIITTAFQILILFLFHNYIAYLLIECIFQFISKIYLNIKINKIYPEIMKKNEEKLTKDDKKTITNKIKALIFHKIGEVSIYQTDNILTSIFVSTKIVGLVSNFVLIINIVNKFIMSFFNSAIAGLGNIIAVETKIKQLKISKVYDFLSFCFYGWSTLCLYFLLTPFIRMWIGENNLIDSITVSLLCVNYYLTGMRVALSNIKSAAGVYEQDKLVPIFQSLINIVASIICAKFMGLKGIYIGTLISSMVPNIIRPRIVYKYVFEEKSIMYFKEYVFRIMLMIICVILYTLLFNVVTINIAILNIIFRLSIISITFVLLLFIVYKNSEEGSYLKKLFSKIVLRRD